jgi:dTMP kinase
MATSNDAAVATEQVKGPVSHTPRRGAFIVLEGLDRSGKTTQVELLEKRFTDAGKPVQLMRFPGTSLFSFSLEASLPLVWRGEDGAGEKLSVCVCEG